MELPSTSPSGRNPTSRTSRNSLTDRSEVKMPPGWPGRSSASRFMASCGTPLTSTLPWAPFWFRSVIVLLARSKPHPRGLAALRVQGQHGQRRGWRPVARREPGDGRPDDGRLDDMVAAALLHRAFPLADAHVHVVHDHPAGAVPGDVALELDAGVVPGLGDQVGVAVHLGV